MSMPESYHVTPTQQAEATTWFAALRDKICATFEQIEAAASSNQTAARFVRRDWQRDEANGGGGTMALLQGRVFEKVGVNISTVHGTFAPDFRQQIPGAGADGAFWASGISVVAHMASPLVPAVHMNTRLIVTSRSWFGGGADLTPMFPESAAAAADAASFHAALQTACDQHDPAYYPRFKQACDDYFYLPHRGEPRGAGGIFYDTLNSGDFAADFAFTRAVGTAFLTGYLPIIAARQHTPWTAAER
jgi:coproporphyrinogen III oxidase